MYTSRSTCSTVSEATPAVTGGSVGGACQGALTFEIAPPDVRISNLVNFTEKQVVTSAKECANLCFTKHCTIAGYTPSLAGEAAQCMMTYTEDSSCGKYDKVQDVNDTSIVELHCIQCGGVGHVIEATPQSATKGPETVGTPSEGATTTAPEAADSTTPISQVRHCVGNLTFAAGPGAGVNLTEVSKTTMVSTAKACAEECYAHACTKAIYRPSNFHPSEIEATTGAPCLLSFDPVDSCPAAVTVSDAGAADSTVITCLNCSKCFSFIVCGILRKSGHFFVALTEPILIPSNNTGDESAQSKPFPCHASTVS